MPTTEGFPGITGSGIARGGPAATALEVGSGLLTTDTLLNVQHVSGDLVTNADVTAEATIPTAGHVQLSTTATTGDFLIVTWVRQP